MIIECQSCGKKYRFDENQLKSYSKYEIPCKACGHPLDIGNFAHTSSVPQQLLSQKRSKPPLEKERNPQQDDFLDQESEVDWRHSIQFKFTLNICMVMLFILILYTLINTVNTKRQMTEDLNSLAQRTATRLSKSLLAPLWEVDEIQIQEYIVSEMMEEKIYGIIIKDIDRKTILYGSKRRNHEIFL